MNLGNNIYKLRTFYNMTQEQFAAALGVSRQSVQKWESGAAAPDLAKLIAISSQFGISLDTLVKNYDKRMIEELSYEKHIQISTEKMQKWEVYSSELMTEYTQSFEEGRDIEQYKELFGEVLKMPPGEHKEKMADVLFDLAVNLPQRKDYRYTEPSELDKIKLLRDSQAGTHAEAPKNIKEKIRGAAVGRICGCVLGKPVECFRTDAIIPLLKSGNNYPMHRYISSQDLTDELCEKHRFVRNSAWIDTLSGAPVDDDLNYTVMGSIIIDKYGRDFSPYDVANTWIELQSKNAYCTAERVAFKNFINGYMPPMSAVYKNPYREWIGAQIRADYYGYINPGDPETAADMAWRDASISHVKNGIYGAMCVAAMLAQAAVCDNIEEIIITGLSQVPNTSRLYEAVMKILDGYKKGLSKEECFAGIHKTYDEYSPHDWCHTISNISIVAASMLYGGGDFGKSICMAVETGFDTDCNGATVGSIIGMRNGISGIDEKWYEPFNNTLDTSIFGVGSISFDALCDKILEHISK